MQMKDKKIAAIDIGSNALRIQLFTKSDDGEIHAFKTLREPVRLGKDVFHTGKILRASLANALKALKEFRQIIDDYRISKVEAVATSAVRESENKAEFISMVRKETGIKVNVIDGTEEARLIIKAVMKKIPLASLNVVHIEVGGGSVEVSLIEDGKIQFCLTHKLGAVRLMEYLKAYAGDDEKFHEIADKYVGITHKRLQHSLGRKKIDRFIATGGNIDSIVWLIEQTGWGKLEWEKGVVRIGCDLLHTVIKKLTGYNLQERIEKLRLRPNRADVILPAAIVYESFARCAKVDSIYAPGVGVRDGIAIEYLENDEKMHKDEKREQLVSAVHALSEKYEFNWLHATNVASYSLDLFDALKDIHMLGERERLLIELAAYLHDIGYFVGIPHHHKHSQYLIAESNIMGLSHRDIVLIANIARYHRKSFPKEQHESFNKLTGKEKIIIIKLASILRIADALDREHLEIKMPLSINLGKNSLIIGIPDYKRLELERLAIPLKGKLFTRTFGYRLEVTEYRKEGNKNDKGS